MHIDRIRTLFEEYRICLTQMYDAAEKRGSRWGIGVHDDLQARIWQMYKMRAFFIDEQIAGPSLVSCIALEAHNGELVWFDRTNRSWAEWRIQRRKELAIARNALRRMGYFNPDRELEPAFL